MTGDLPVAAASGTYSFAGGVFLRRRRRCPHVLGQRFTGFHDDESQPMRSTYPPACPKACGWLAVEAEKSVPLGLRRYARRIFKEILAVGLDRIADHHPLLLPVVIIDELVALFDLFFMISAKSDESLTICGVIKIRRLRFALVCCDCVKRRPKIGMSPSIGTFDLVLEISSPIKPPRTTVSPSFVTTAVDTLRDCFSGREP
jgi:hypothetical protein